MITAFLAASTTVSPGPGLILFSVVMLLALCAVVVTALKGLWLWVLAGMCTSGLACFYSAFQPAKPDSAWARLADRRARSRSA